jgi:hypothetical protein
MAAVEYSYDAFISYSHKDRPWVDRHLLPALERAGLRVAIDYRDFPLGRIAQENMERVVGSSRHIVLVMSPNWVQSEWSGFEYFFASADDPVAREGKIVPLLIAATELPRRHQFRTYADLTNPETYEREIGRVIEALHGNAGRSASVDGPSAPPVTTPMPVLATPSAGGHWQADLADLLIRSGRAQTSARRALCIEIGVDADGLSFLDAAPRDFAVQLVNQLEATGDTNALLTLCGSLGRVVKGAFAAKLQAVISNIRGFTPG